VRVDCTVVESNSHHPTDSTLLWDSVRVLSRLTQRAQEISGIVVTDHRRRAKRRALGILNARKNTDRVSLYRDLLKVARKTLNDAERVRRELKHVPTTAPLTAMALEAELEHYGALAAQVIRQTERRVIAGESLRPEDKIVSIFEPHTDIIIKDQREIFFGHKVTITGGALTDAGLRLAIVVSCTAVWFGSLRSRMLTSTGTVLFEGIESVALHVAVNGSYSSALASASPLPPPAADRRDTLPSGHPG